ncbi:RNA-binding S4 domain-containing protein [Streptomyces sp. NPDC015171]|uniref:RNA-binding S4 domain-containing protein n=1 Tax=Streptomyces sp. NPDC015171 TaxID=3364945 RepID=UPI0036FA8EA1
MASEDADENVDRGTSEESGAGTGVPDGTASTPAPADPPLDPKTIAVMAAAGPAAGERVRIDSWIWAVRLIKSRSLGATACRGGHVHVNGTRVKPVYSVRVGDEVRLRHDGRERIVIVKHLIRKRVGAPVAALCYIDNSPPPPPREAVGPVGVRDRGTGRPTKRERRELDRLRGLTQGAPRGFAGLADLGGLGGPGGTTGSGGRGGRGGSGGRDGSGGPGGRDESGGSGGHGRSDGQGGRPRGR